MAEAAQGAPRSAGCRPGDTASALSVRLASTEEEAPNPCGLNTYTDNTTYEPLGLGGLEVDGFDLDGEVSEGGGLCAHDDFVSPGGEPGIDFGFLHVIDKGVRLLRQQQDPFGLLLARGWMIVYLAVSAQMVWSLRPIIGHPDVSFRLLGGPGGNMFTYFLQNVRSLLL